MDVQIPLLPNQAAEEEFEYRTQNTICLKGGAPVLTLKMLLGHKDF